MANTNVTPVQVKDVNTISPKLIDNAVAATTDSFIVDVAQSMDKKLVFIADNSASTSAATTVTVKAGANVAGVNDLTLSVPKGEKAFFQLDSNAYMNASGVNKGKIVIAVSSADCKLAVAELR